VENRDGVIEEEESSDKNGKKNSIYEEELGMEFEEASEAGSMEILN
jgi:hypothetical protein